MDIKELQINQYLNEELTGEHLIAFEAQLESDTDFKNQVEFHKELDAILMDNYLDLEEEVFNEEKANLQPFFDEMKQEYFNTEIKDLQINQYLNGELTGKDLVTFEELIKTDTNFKNQVDFHQELDSILTDNHLDLEEEVFNKEKANLQPFFDEMKEEYFKESSTKVVSLKENKSSTTIVRKLFPMVSLAAAAALLLFLFIPKQENNLYNQFFEVPGIGNTLSEPPLNPTTLDKANEAYKATNYKEAIPLFEQSLQEDPNNPKALLYKGGAELAINKTNQAISTFEQLKTDSPRYADIANWYLALCYVKKGDEAKAKNTLELISQENEAYYKKAKQLLKSF